MIKRLLLTVCVACFLSFAACSSGGTGGAGDAPVKGVQPPASSTIAKIKEGMSDEEVSKLIGWPTSQNAYLTGKSWIPFYWGPDTTRTDWKYKGQGRVVFSRNTYSGQLKVVRIDYDPSERAE